jgi:hypothetical protein
MHSREHFRDLPPAKRIAVVAGAAVQLTLLAAAQRDIQRRPAAEIRGSKLRWRLICLINFVGPLSYFAFGRQSPPPAPEEQEHGSSGGLS